MEKTYEVMDKGSRKADEITTKAKNGVVEQPIILDHIEQFAESFHRYNYELPLTCLKEDREKAEKTGAYLKAIEGSSNEFIKNLRQQNEEITKAIENFIMKIEDMADVDASKHFESCTSSKPL